MAFKNRAQQRREEAERKLNEEKRLEELERKRSLIGILDVESVESGQTKIQDEWITYWNAKDDKVFASMGHYYRLFKRLKEDEAEAEKYLPHIRKDLQEDLIITSTRIEYSGESFGATITHHYGCDDDSLVKEIEVEIPVYCEKKIEDVISDDKDLEFLQAYFDTEDDADEIIETLEYISDKPRDKIKLWAPSLSQRSDTKMKVAILSINGNAFHIVAYCDLDGSGRSRGRTYK